MQHESINFLLGDVSRLMRRAFQQRLEGSRLTLAQSKALVHIARNEGVRQVDLAETLEVQPITLARLIDQLVEEALVERRKDPNDRRAHRIFLTEAAAPHLDAIKEVGAIIRAQAMSDFSQDDIDQMSDLLRRMRANLASQAE